MRLWLLHGMFSAAAQSLCVICRSFFLLDSLFFKRKKGQAPQWMPAPMVGAYVCDWRAAAVSTTPAPPTPPCFLPYSAARMRPTSMPWVMAMPWLMPGQGSG